MLAVSVHVNAEEFKLQKRDSKTFFEILNVDNMDLVDQFYAEDVHFIDPLVEFNRREEVKHYYASSYASVKTISFDIQSVVNEGDEQVLVWRMTTTAEKLNKGKPIVTDGISHIRYNQIGQAVYHRDYFDMGEMIYSHVPIVRGLVGYVNKKMRKSHVPND